MTTDIITERLSIHVNSFQESFEVLSNSVSPSAMALKFDKILRGSFITSQTGLFHRDNSNEEWISYLKITDDRVISMISDVDKASGKIFSTKDNLSLYSVAELIDSTSIGFVLGEKLDGSPYTNVDKITFQIFIQIFCSAYQVLLSHSKEKQLIFSLNNRVSQLYNLIDTGIEISQTSFGYKLFELALCRAISLTNSSFGRILITNDKGEKQKIFFPPNTDYDNSRAEYTLSIVFIDEGSEYEFSICEKESRNGILKYDETDELLLGAISKQVQAAIENNRYHKEALENETMKRELAVASEIQKRILPEKLPNIPGFDISGINIPSKEVSGDYFNVFKLENNNYAIIVADVTGKGMPASLLVSTLDASLRSYLDFQIPLSEMAVKMNSIIFKSSTADKFITFFIAVLNPENGELDIINAGHNPALIVRQNGELEKINAGGVAFGMFDMGLPFESQKLVIEKGERLFIYSDGIPEAMDKDEEEYSDEKMEDFCRDFQAESSKTFISSIVNDVRNHSTGVQQSDDITAIYLIRK